MNSTSPQAQKKIKFDYIKAQLFRTARADGAWAGTNGFSDLVLSFYSERTPIPKTIVHLLTEENNLGTEVLAERVIRDSVVREVEFSVSMSLEVAKSLRELIDRQVQALEAAKKALTEKTV